MLISFLIDNPYQLSIMYIKMLFSTQQKPLKIMPIPHLLHLLNVDITFMIPSILSKLPIYYSKMNKLYKSLNNIMFQNKVIFRTKKVIWDFKEKQCTKKLNTRFNNRSQRLLRFLLFSNWIFNQMFILTSALTIFQSMVAGKQT